jgi:flagellin-like hook-associated protein FlgL
MSEVSLSSSIRSSLTSLNSTSKLLEQTTERLSTGEKVSSAIDNPTNYFAAENYNSTADSLSDRLDGMSEATEMINSADNGITNIKAYLSQMKGIVNDALSNTDSDERAALGEQFNELIVQIRDMASDSDYGGVNLINGNASTTVEFGEGVGDSTLTLQGFNITAASTAVNTVNGEIEAAANYINASGNIATGATTGCTAYALTIDLNGTDAVGLKSAGTSGDAWEIDWSDDGYNTDGNANDLNSIVEQIEDLESTLKTQSSKLANNLSIITTREDFTDEKINILEEGADNLTLADLNEEGANLLSLQTSQSLGVKSLTLASNQTASVLTLLS